MKWKRMERKGTKWNKNGMEENGNKQNGTEYNITEWNGHPIKIDDT